MFVLKIINNYPEIYIFFRVLNFCVDVCCSLSLWLWLLLLLLKMRSFVLLCLLFSLLGMNEVMGVSLEIGPGQEECLFLKEVEKETALRFRYQVVDGGAMDIDVAVYEPDGQKIHQELKRKEGKFVFKTRPFQFDEYTYKFCLSNKFSTVTSKIVSFSLHSGTETGPVAKREHISPIEDSVLKVESDVKSLFEEIDFLIVQEENHRATSEETFDRVTYATIFEGIVLITVNCWQIFTLRRFFEVKRHI